MFEPDLAMASWNKQLDDHDDGVDVDGGSLLQTTDSSAMTIPAYGTGKLDLEVRDIRKTRLLT